MSFTHSKIFIACAIASTLFISACSKSENENKTGTLTASAPATGEASTLTERNAQHRLIQTLTEHFKTAGLQAQIENVKPTEVPNLFWVELKGLPALYATADGKYIFQGDVIRLGDKKLFDVSEPLQAETNKALLGELNPKDLIVYKAKGKTKHIVYIFTDVSCPYCHKLHEQIDEMNAKGIEVRYIAWPRGEEFIPTMESVWCSKDRQTAFNQAISGEELPPASCKNPVLSQYELGIKMGVNGTPAIYTQDGVYLGGYLSANELSNRLNN